MIFCLMKNVLVIRKQSNIKVSFVIVAHVLGLDHLLGIEDDFFLLDVRAQEVEGLLVHVVVHHEEAVVHTGGQIVVVLDC